MTYGAFDEISWETFTKAAISPAFTYYYCSGPFTVEGVRQN